MRTTLGLVGAAVILALGARTLEGARRPRTIDGARAIGMEREIDRMRY